MLIWLFFVAVGLVVLLRVDLVGFVAGCFGYGLFWLVLLRVGLVARSVNGSRQTVIKSRPILTTLTKWKN
jgi:hypothetical protein